MPRISSLLVTALLPAGLAASSPLIHVTDRQGLSLNGDWKAILDPYEVGYYNYRLTPFDDIKGHYGAYYLDESHDNPSALIEYDFDKAMNLTVPGDWNHQDPTLLYYEGTVWYRTKFDYAALKPGRRVFLHFGGANYQTDVYLNGEKLGRHIGGFTPFQFEVTDLLKAGSNSLVVKVDNRRHPEDVPTINTDWWNYGGITRDVTLYEVPAQPIADYRLELEHGEGDNVDISVRVDGVISGTVDVSIPELGAQAKLALGEDGLAAGKLHLEGLQRWSPEHPKLYAVTLSTATDSITEEIGFRTIETRGGQILLNGQPIFLRGICAHEENPFKPGRAVSEADDEILLNWAKELGCNFMRLAHYPHNVHMARLADRLGILLWEEVPVYWTIQWENPDTLANARQQLTDLILRDRNRASVIVWSVANETPPSDARLSFLKNMIETARALDSSRLVSAAMEKRGSHDDPNLVIVDDPLMAYTDLVSFNEYVGWYDGMPDKCRRVHWQINSDKPVMISECGGGALQGLHADPRTRFSEELQAELYRETPPMLERIPNFAGMTPWVLVDFRSPRRNLGGVQDGWNRKGLIGSNGEKKAAFEVLKEYYRAKQ